MGHQRPTPASEMHYRGCQYTLDAETCDRINANLVGTSSKYVAIPGVYGDHAEYTPDCFACHLASGGGDD